MRDIIDERVKGLGRAAKAEAAWDDFLDGVDSGGMWEASELESIPSLVEAFRRTAAAHPDRVAVASPGGEDAITWGQLRRRAESVAGGLASLGVGQRVCQLPGRRG